MDNTIIRIGHIIGKWVGGGVESVVMNYYRHIDRTKIQFDFICDEDSTHIPYDEIKALGGRVILVPPYQKIIKYQKELIKLFRENKYQIVHSHINTLSVFPLRAAKKAGVPVRIAHSHSTTNKRELKKNLIKQLLRHFSRKYATNFMCCSEYAGRWLFGDKIYDQGKVYLLNNAIDIRKFSFNIDVRKKKRNELGISEDVLVMGHIGRLVEQKNHIFLIDIFNEMQKLRPKSLLLLLGDGPLQNDLAEKVIRLNLADKIIFAGVHKDAYAYYQMMDCFVLPSLYEGLPVVGVEAQINGLPCFFSDTITKEVCINNNSELISLNKSAKEWAKIIYEKINSSINEEISEKRSQQSNKFVGSKYDIEKEATKLLDLYDSMMGRND